MIHLVVNDDLPIFKASSTHAKSNAEVVSISPSLLASVLRNNQFTVGRCSLTGKLVTLFLVLSRLFHVILFLLVSL